MPAVALMTIIANHTPATGGGESSPMVGWVFAGLVGTAAWVLFSQLRWRYTMIITVTGWALGLGLLLGL